MPTSLSPLDIALIAAGSAIVATLLTIILTPRMQHYFWKLQRREELRLATINEIIRVTTEFVATYVAGRPQSPEKFLASLWSMNGQVRAFFSIDTALVYTRLMAMIRPTLGQELLDGRVSIGEFLETRNLALLALYEETGIIPRNKQARRVLELLIEQAQTRTTPPSSGSRAPG